MSLRTIVGYKDIRARFAAKVAQDQLRAEVQQTIARHEPLKVVIGSGPVQGVVGEPSTNYEGWLFTDRDILDALDEAAWARVFPRKSIHRVLAEHVIEHWTINQFKEFLNISKQFLTPDAVIRLAVPDGFHPDPEYVEAVRPGGNGSGAEDHKVLYNYRLLSDVLRQDGTRFALLEYFDENGNFHKTDWQIADGFVWRSELHDQRNFEKPLSYTSLIVDIYNTDPNA